jgi:hypothetical protein
MPGSLRALISAIGPVSLAIPLLLLATAGFGVAVGAGQSAPNAYYGNAETDSGAPIQQGTVIVAVAGENPREVKDSITVDPAGKYGGSGGFDEKLRVSSEYAEVTFHIGDKDGKQAIETDNPTAETERLDLTFSSSAPAGATPTQTATDTQTPTDTQTATATQTTTSTATQSSTATATATDSQATTATQTQSGDAGSAGSDRSTTSSGSQSDVGTESGTPTSDDSTDAVAGGTRAVNGTETSNQGGGLVPWGLLRTGVLFVILPAALIYGVLKGVAIYYDY